MAIDKDKIKKDFKSLILKTSKVEDTEKAIEEFSEGLSEIVSEAILSLEVKAPIARIQVKGSPTSQFNTEEISFETD